MFRTLRIQLTEECNLRCLYCCHEGTMCDYSILKNRNIVSFIRASRDVLGIKRVKFTGGEPLMYDENICEIINSVDRNDVKFSIVTNATNYGAFVKLLKECNNLEVTISLPVPPDEIYLNHFQSITGTINKCEDFKNILKCISYMNFKKENSYKINYVLCNTKNTDKEMIGKMIEFAQENPNVQVRFLETIVNLTNNYENINKYVFTQDDFENRLKELGYTDIAQMKYDDKRSTCMYRFDKISIKFIKAFCNDTCEKCPEDKTSLWLTSTGHIKDCSFNMLSRFVDNWQYNKIVRLLEKYL